MFKKYQVKETLAIDKVDRIPLAIRFLMKLKLFSVGSRRYLVALLLISFE